MDDDRGEDAGAVYLYHDTSPTGDWSSYTERKVYASNTILHDHFGSRLALEGSVLAVAAEWNTEAGQYAGAVYRLDDTSPGGDWSSHSETKLSPSDHAAYDLFGTQIDVDGGDIFVGSPRNDSIDVDAGAVYVYDDDPNVDLAIAKADAYDPAYTNGPLAYTLSVTNNGPYQATVVEVTDTLPAGVGYADASGDGWACSEDSGSVTCTRATLDVGAAPDITIEVTAPSTAGSISNTASVAGAETDPTPANDADTEGTDIINCIALVMANNAAADIDPCGYSGVTVSWAAPSDWGDGGYGTRTFDVLRDGAPLASGLNEATLSFDDLTGTPDTAYLYSVRANNGCGQSATTAGESAADADATPTPPTIDLISDPDPVNQSGVEIAFTNGSPMTSADLWVDGAEAAVGIMSPHTYDPGDVEPHSYVVRTWNGSCYADSDPQSFTDLATSVPPGETAPGDTLATALTWTDATTLTWPANPNATNYLVYRGTYPLLPEVITALDDSCTKYSGSAATATDADDPTGETGRMYWYLVTGENGAGEGPAGNATAGAREINSTGACP